MVYVWEPVSEGLADFPEKQRMTGRFFLPDEFYRKKRLGLAITEDDLPTDRLDGPFAIPEIFNVVMNFTIVSAEVRRAIESYAPGGVKFHRLPFAISERMQARSQYFYPEVVACEQRLDWQKTPLKLRSATNPDGTPMQMTRGYIYSVPIGKQVYTPVLPVLRNIVFRSGPIDDKIWCEPDIETDNEYRTISKEYEFLSDSLWERLNLDFLGNLRSRKLKTGSPLN